jgi:hypothetical protein
MRNRQERFESFIKVAINKMLERHGVDYDYVKENSLIGGVNWYQHYTWTEEECKQFEIWFKEIFVKKKLGGHRMADKVFTWFDLMWGLKVVDY